MPRVYNPETSNLEKPVDPVYDKLISLLLEQYEPAASGANAYFRLTTSDLFGRFQAIYPSTTYTALDIFNSLTQLGFNWNMESFGNFYWFFKLK